VRACGRADRPDPPGKPEVTDSDKDHISIKWTPPKKDGGSPITGYNVERRDPKTGRWTKLNSDPLPVTSSTFNHCHFHPFKTTFFDKSFQAVVGSSRP